jgi:hypothetical protein
MPRIITGLRLILAFTLAACGDNAAPANNPQPTAETENQFEAALTDVASQLSETFTSEDGVWTVEYPSGWVVSSPIPNLILIASSEATANKTFSTTAFDAGEAAVQLGLNTIVGDPISTAQHVADFAGSIGIPLGDASELTIGGRQAGRVDGSNDNRHLMVISSVYGDSYVGAVTYTNPAEFAQMEQTLVAIIESVNYSNE